MREFLKRGAFTGEFYEVVGVLSLLAIAADYFYPFLR